MVVGDRVIVWTAAVEREVVEDEVLDEVVTGPVEVTAEELVTADEEVDGEGAAVLELVLVLVVELEVLEVVTAGAAVVVASDVAAVVEEVFPNLFEKT